MSQPIIFYYDFVSPYSYFAFSQLDMIRAKTRRAVVLKPVSVGKIMVATGNVPTSVTCQAKRHYAAQDLGRWARKLSVALNLHPEFGQFSTVPLLQAAIRSGDDIEAFSSAVFKAIWVDRVPMKDTAILSAWLAEQNQGFAEFWDEREHMIDALAANNGEAIAHGAFGVPYYFTDRGAFFGNDRIDFLIESLSS
jgi:2-hydroxychromene-2-carboxylate isomerase